VSERRWRSLLIGVLLLASLSEFSIRGPLRLFDVGMEWNDFLSPYIQTRAWLHGADPYDAQSLIVFWPSHNPRPTFVDADAAKGVLEKNCGMPSPYPLTSLVLLSVFAVLPWRVALTAWIAISVVAVVLAASALVEVCGRRLQDPRSVIFLALAFALAPVHTGLATANPAILSVSLVVGTFWAVRKNRNTISAVLLALAVCLKPTVAGGFLLYFVVRRHWRLLATTSVVTVVVALIGWVRLAVAGMNWIPSYLENSRRMFAVGSVDDFTRASWLRFNLLNAQVFFGGLVRDASMANLLARLLGVILLISWIWLCWRRRSSTGLLEISAISILSLIAVYHRFYDAALLMLPLAWSVLLVSRRSAALLTLATIAPFLVPGPALLAYFASTERIPMSIAGGWWWNGVVMPHEAWDLILLSLLLLYFLWTDLSETTAT
jgi:hypothetical protein